MSNGVEKITNSEKETFNFAKNFAKKLKGGEVIGLVGELGAGKTIFTKGLAAGLGIKKHITSPTFVLMKVYEVKSPAYAKALADKQKSKVKSLCHIDAYRIKNAQDITAIGAKEYFNRLNTITIVEWADKIKKILPKKTKFVSIINKEEDKRLIRY